MIQAPNKKSKRARGIIIENGKILLINRVKKDDLYWTIPGGGVEVGETLEQALQREAIEELGVEVEVGIIDGKSF